MMFPIHQHFYLLTEDKNKEVEGAYGSPRWIPIHPDGLEILSNYLNARRMKLEMGTKKALITASRKMLSVIFAMLKSGSDFRLAA